MVVRSLYFSGNLKNNTISHEIDSNNFNLQIGNWRMCIDSLVVKTKGSGKKEKFSYPATVSVNWFKAIQEVWKKFRPNDEEATVRTRELNPSPLLVTILSTAEKAQLLQVVSGSETKQWFSFKDVGQLIELSFKNEDNAAQLLDLTVYVVILLERIE
jgi:hypothetical protein